MDTTNKIPPAAGAKITPDVVRSQMKIPPNLQSAYDRIIMAGKKIMYSDQMSPQIATLLKGQGTPGQKIGQGVVALMALMITKSNHTIPPQLIVPAATELVTVFADFLRQTGLQVTDADTAEGMSVMVSTIMAKAGITPDKLQAMLKQGGGAAPAAPAQPAAAPQGGLVAGASAPAGMGA